MWLNFPWNDLSQKQLAVTKSALQNLWLTLITHLVCLIIIYRYQYYNHTQLFSSMRTLCVCGDAINCRLIITFISKIGLNENPIFYSSLQYIIHSLWLSECWLLTLIDVKCRCTKRYFCHYQPISMYTVITVKQWKVARVINHHDFMYFFILLDLMKGFLCLSTFNVI